MSPHASQNEDRLLQLLADRATEGLDSRAVEELNDLLRSHSSYHAVDLEPAAAAIDIAMTPPPPDPMPAGLRDRVLIEAGRFLTSQRNSRL